VELPTVSTAPLFLLAFARFYQWEDDAKKDSETEGCLPVNGACVVSNQVPQQRHDNGNDQANNEHNYEINEKFLDIHFSLLNHSHKVACALL
jgi:hypothetical protein